MNIPVLLCEFKRMYETLNIRIKSKYSFTIGSMKGIKKNDMGKRMIENTAPKIPPVK